MAKEFFEGTDIPWAIFHTFRREAGSVSLKQQDDGPETENQDDELNETLTGMNYIPVSYTHLLYEVDTENERLALRSIDIFADCRTRNIPDLYDGAIEITPIPTVEELNAHVWGEEFHACIIEKAEFEAIWESHTYDGALKESGGF